MMSYTQGDTRPVLTATDLANYVANGSAVLDSRRTRPLWFDGRFLTARDLEREQNYFLQRQADLGKAPGLSEIHARVQKVDPETCAHRPLKASPNACKNWGPDAVRSAFVCGAFTSMTRKGSINSSGAPSPSRSATHRLT